MSASQNLQKVFGSAKNIMGASRNMSQVAAAQASKWLLWIWLIF